MLFCVNVILCESLSNRDVIFLTWMGLGTDIIESYHVGLYLTINVPILFGFGVKMKCGPKM